MSAIKKIILSTSQIFCFQANDVFIKNWLEVYKNIILLKAFIAALIFLVLERLMNRQNINKINIYDSSCLFRHFSLVFSNVFRSQLKIKSSRIPSLIALHCFTYSEEVQKYLSSFCRPLDGRNWTLSFDKINCVYK